VSLTPPSTAAMHHGAPLRLPHAGPPTGHGHLMRVAQWTGLTRPRHQAVWLVVPHIGRSHGRRLDGEPLALNSPSQFLTLDSEWIDTRSHLLPTGVDARPPPQHTPLHSTQQRTHTETTT